MVVDWYLVTMESARVLMKVICVLAVLQLAAAQLVISADYPGGTSNRSHVTLTCRNGIIPISDAQFQKDGIPLTQGSANNQVTSLIEGDDQVTFTFTQAQEGMFRCVGDGEMSPEIGLAGNDSKCV